MESKHWTIDEKAKSCYSLFFAFSFHIYQQKFHFVGVSIGPWSTCSSIGRAEGKREAGLFYTLSCFSPTRLLLHPFLFVASDLFTLLMFDLLQESDYFTPQGEFRVDAAGSPILLNCLMYKMCYYRFGEMQVIWM